MDAVTGCQEKLLYFTVKDLQSVLAQIGLPKSRKKKDLTDRILAELDATPTRQEEIVRCIDRAFRNIQKRKKEIQRREIAPAIKQVTKAAPVRAARPDFDLLLQKEDRYRFQCICGSTLLVDPIIQCENSRCRTWQHAGCVIVSDPVDQQFNIPTRFLCEICRIQQADPFWLTTAYPLLPVKLVPSLVASDCLSPALCVEKTFQLSDRHMQLLQCNGYELQAWSMLMNDKVQFRMHWPLDSNFHINGTKFEVLGRPSSQLLGTNSRDDGALIKAYSKEGLNKITLAWNDTRTFCFGIRIAKRRTIDQVLNIILSNKGNGESLEDALARVRRCIGGNDTKSDSTDSDLEVVDDCVTINLRCPISGSRMKVAARFKPCMHMGCFDLYTFVNLNQRTRKWQCPICLKNYSLENLIIDPYFTKITSMLSMFDEELTEIEVHLDGLWRLKAKDGLNGSDFPWHSTNESISDPKLNPNINHNHNQVESEVNKLYKYEESLVPSSNKGLITDENIRAHFGGKHNLFNGTGSCSWFQPDSQYYPNVAGSVTTLISPPCGDKGDNLHNGNDADLRTLCNVDRNQGNASSGNMSMQDGTCQEDWIPLSLAAGIVHPVNFLASDSVSTIHNLSAMSSFGLPPNSGTLLPKVTSNQPKVLTSYNIFSPQVTPELFHVTDPNFQL